MVVTPCEDEAALGNWYSSKEESFANIEMKFAGVVSVCAIDLKSSNLDPELKEIYARKRTRTQQQLRKEIELLAPSRPWIPEDFDQFFVCSFIGFCDYFGIFHFNLFCISSIAITMRRRCCGTSDEG